MNEPSLATREQAQAKRVIEALLFTFGEPLSIKRIQGVLEGIEAVQVKAIIQELNTQYSQHACAFEIQEVAGGYQLKTDPQLAPWIQKAIQQPKGRSVSKAALETLAIIAYRQPMTKAEIETIRGVDAGAALDALLERDLVKIAGKRETPGRPFLYGTTQKFLQQFGLKSLSALPQADPIHVAVEEFSTS